MNEPSGVMEILRPRMSAPESENPSEASADSGIRPSPTGALLSLFWAALGPVFMEKAGHFGPGFGPMLVWLLSIPVIALVLMGATIYKIEAYLNGQYGSEARLWAVALWPISICVYVGIGIYLLVV